MRIVLAMFVITMSLGPSQAVFGQSDAKREQIIEQYVSKTHPNLVVLAGPTDQRTANEAASAVIVNTDETFSHLKSSNLLNAKLYVYEAAWSSLKATLKADPQNRATLTEMNAFKKNIALAAAGKGTKSTIYVSASKGNGATVRYAKTVDAARPDGFRLLGVTPLSAQELERATYIFKAFRSGIETGSTGAIACIQSTTYVSISEN